MVRTCIYKKNHLTLDFSCLEGLGWKFINKGFTKNIIGN